MLQDLIFACRLLWKEKAFTTAALLTLALCIGANTAIFTVLDSVVLRGLPVPEQDRLVTLYNVYPGVGVEVGANAIPDYLDRRKLSDVFSEVSLFGSSGYDVGQTGSPQHVNGQYVTPSFFRVLKIQPVLGRAFTEEEATIGKEHVAILSEGLWKDMFSRDPNVTGKDIRLSGELYRIVGVMPDAVSLLDRDARLWVPFAFTPQQTSDDARHSNSWSMIARLKNGADVAYARQRIDALNRENLNKFPKYRPILITARFGTKVLGLRDEMVKEIRPTLYLLQAAVGLVLLIGCVNLANIMLLRSNVRMKELAVRFSLGAGRWRIARQLLTESVVLALAGGPCGVAVGWGGVQLLAYLGAKDLPRGATIALDGRVLAVTALTALLTGLIFGSVPLFHLFRQNLTEVFRGNERGGTAGRKALWVRSALVVCQVALAFVLLIASGLLTLSFARLLKVKPGFQPEHVMTTHLSLPASRYKDDQPTRAFVTRVLGQVRAIPGVRHASVTSVLPFSNQGNASVLGIVGRSLAPGENPPVPTWNFVDSGYLPAIGIPLLKGRNLVDSDTDKSQKVVLIDQFLEHKYWPSGGAIGQKVILGGGLDPKAPQFTIVGVVGSVKTSNLAEQNPVGQVYFTYQQMGNNNFHLVVKAEREDAQLTSSIRREVLKVDPELSMFDTKTMPERLASSLVNQRAAMVLCLVFGGLALMLSGVGIYGVLAYSVTQRMREFGIRSALGANARDVVGMVVGQGLRMSAIGLLIGAVSGFAITRLMTTLLYDVKPADPAVFLGVSIILGTVAMCAALIPSVRAARIQPSSALRHE